MKPFKGIQFIGDPHASSLKPGRRKDGYGEGVIAKLEECRALSHEHQLVTVILGDLFHTATEHSLPLLNGMSRVLRGFYSPVFSLTGNHDNNSFALDDSHALTFFILNGTVIPLADELVQIGDTSVRLIGKDHGVAIPDEVAREGADIVALVTHHDLAFGRAYPGALPLKEIKGADFVVNGHMHDNKPSVTVGTTVWHNPGNIEPLSVDLRDHVPASWVWTPGTPGHTLACHVLASHDPDCFDMTGLTVAAVNPLDAVGALSPSAAPAATPGEFATELAAQDSMAAARTDDASILEDDLGCVLEVADVQPGTKELMLELLARLQSKQLSA